MPKRRWTDAEFRDAVTTSHSIAGALKRLELVPTGANYAGFHAHAARLEIDTSHFLGQGHMKGKTRAWGSELPLHEILVRSSNYLNRHQLKRRLLKAGLLDERCEGCGISTWRNAPLSLHLDHINGEYNDNRIANLRLLCPNCHSQTATYGGRNKMKKK